MLYSYPKVKAEIENIKIDIEELNDSLSILGIKGASNNKIKPTSPTYAFNSNVENETIERDEKIKYLSSLLRSKERFIRKIENCLDTLTEEERKLVEMKYFKRNKLDRIAEILDVSTITIVRKRRDIILELIDVL